MTLLLYSPQQLESSHRLRTALQQVTGEDQFEVFESLEGLRHRLHQPKNNPTIAVLQPQDRTELQAMAAMVDLLSDYRIILIVPDETHKTIQLAHRLTPRFILCASEPLDPVASVVDQMTARYMQAARPCCG